MLRLDVLQGDLSEKDIFMEQPEGFAEPRAPKKVCRLRKALYGLKQSSRVWNTKLDAELKRIGQERSSFDSSVYYHSSGYEVIGNMSTICWCFRISRGGWHMSEKVDVQISHERFQRRYGYVGPTALHR